MNETVKQTNKPKSVIISAYLILFILNSRMGTFSDSCIFHGMLRWWSQTWVGPTAFRVLPRHQQTLRCIPSECLWLQISTDTSCDIHVFGQCVRNISEEAHRSTFCVHSDNLCIISCTFCAIVIVHLTYWVISNLLQNLSRMWLVSGSLASRDADIKACYLVSGDCCCTVCIGQVDQLFNGILLRFKRGNPCKQPMPWRSLVWTPRLVTGLRAYTSNMLGRRVQSHLKPHLPTSNSHHCTTGMATNCPVNWKYHRSIKRWQLCSKSLMFPGFLDTCISLTAQHPEDRVLKTRRRVIMMGLLQYTWHAYCNFTYNIVNLVNHSKLLWLERSPRDLISPEVSKCFDISLDSEVTAARGSSQASVAWCMVLTAWSKLGHKNCMYSNCTYSY